MATFASDLQQQTNEIHTYTVDYTNDLPSAGTVTSATATHTPPSGSTVTVSTSVTSPFVYATVPALTVTGVHYIDVLATFNNGDKSSVRIPLNVVYPTPTARVGMSNIIAELRGLTEAGAADYTIAGAPYWSDAQLQDILDVHRTDIIFEPLTAYPNLVAAGTNSWYDYRTRWKYLEATTGGTAIFYLQNAQGSTQGTSLYTADYRRGQFVFAADQRGTTYYLTGRSYDLNGAAADVWRRKSAHVAPTSFNFSTDNHSVTRSQVYEHSLEMARFFENRSSDAVQSIPMFRSDV